MNIFVLQTGGTLVSSAVPDRSSHKWPLAYTDLFQKRSDRICVPVKAFLVETEGHRILVDTGWSEECATRPVHHLGPALYFGSEPVMKKEEAVPYQLAKMGLAPEDIDAIILTHLDCDHASGLIPLKDAKHVYCSKEEFKHSKKKNVRYHPSFWRGVNIETLEMQDDPQAPFHKSCDLFGDGSIRIYLTPGHTEGSAAVIARGETGYAAFVGDDSYNRHSWEEQKLPGPLYNIDDMKRTLQWVRALSRDKNIIGIYAAHDPEGPKGGRKL